MRSAVGIANIGTSHENHLRGVINRERVGPTRIVRASRRLLDVKRSTAQIRERRRSTHTFDHQELFTSRLELLHVADAGRALGLVAILHEVRDRNSGQNGDDGDHDHDFNEGKTLQYVFHGCVPFFVLFICVDTMPTQNLICKPHAKIYYV